MIQTKQRLPMATRTTSRTHYSESEAARKLGISTEQLRRLIESHILNDGETMRATRRAIFHASDLIILQHLAGSRNGSTPRD